MDAQVWVSLCIFTCEVLQTFCSNWYFSNHEGNGISTEMHRYVLCVFMCIWVNICVDECTGPLHTKTKLMVHIETMDLGKQHFLQVLSHYLKFCLKYTGYLCSLDKGNNLWRNE